MIAASDNIPVFGKITGAVAHRVCIFAHNVGPVFIGCGRVLAHIIDCWIHGANYIGVALLIGLLKLNQSRGIALFDPIVGLRKENSVTTFVAQ